MGTGGREHGLLIRAVLSGVVGVLFGMLSYFAAAQIMLGLLEGRPGDTFYLGVVRFGTFELSAPCHAVFLGSVPAS